MKQTITIWLLWLLASACSSNVRKTAPTNAQLATNANVIPCGVDMIGKLKIAVLVYNGVEVVDMGGPIDVFTKANRLRNHYYVYTVSADSVVKAEKCNLTIKPDYTLANCPQPDILIIPGAPMDVINEKLASDSFVHQVLGWVSKYGTDTTHKIMSVCTGAFLLAKTGLLDGKTATTHYLALTALQQMFPKVHVVGGLRFMQDNAITSTAGITNGIDGALHLLENLEGTDGKMMADSVAHIMVYNRNCPMR